MAARKHDRANSVWPRFCAKRWEVRHDRLSNLLPDPAALQREKALPSTDCSELNLNLKTIRKWAKRESFQKAPVPKRASKLDPFKGEIIRLLERHDYSARQIAQQITEHGYGCQRRNESGGIMAV